MKLENMACNTCFNFMLFFIACLPQTKEKQSLVFLLTQHPVKIPSF